MGKQRVLLILKMAGQRSFATLRTALLALIAVALAATVAACASAHGRAVERGATASFGSYFQQVTGNAAVQIIWKSLGAAVARWPFPEPERIFSLHKPKAPRLLM